MSTPPICISVLTLFIFASHFCVLTFAISIPRRIIYEELCPENQIYLTLPGLVSGCYPIAKNIYESCLRNEQCLINDSFCGIREFVDDCLNCPDDSVEYVCMCKDGFVANWDNSTCEPYLQCSRMDFNPDYVQEDCGKNQFCRNGNCLCKPNFLFNRTGECEWNVPDEDQVQFEIWKSEQFSSQIRHKSTQQKVNSVQSSTLWKHLFIVVQLGFGFALAVALFVLWKRFKYQEVDDQKYQKIVGSIYNFTDTDDDMKLANIEEDDTYHDANNGDPTRYQFGQTVESNPYYWFKHSISDNHVAPLYKDNKQKKYDELVQQLEQDLVNRQTPQLDFTKLKCSRVIQSFIEVTKNKLPCDKICQFTDWFRQMLTGIETKDSLNYEIATLLEQLYQYMQLSPTTFNASKSHNISVIVLALFKCDYFQHSEIDHFLLHLIKKHIRPKFFIIDPLLILSTFDCFEKFKNNKQSLLNNPFIVSAINWWVELFGHLPPVSRLCHMSPGDFQRLQTGMCAKWLRDHVLGDQELKQSNESATLNPLDKTENLKLSSDCFSVRSDCYDRNKWQSIRSVCPVNSDFSDTFYYEAILFTDGPMRIGWATKHTDLSDNPIGNDKLSVAFDGYSQCVINNSTDFANTVLDPESRWSPGDVVGCLIDFTKLEFIFYLNGKILKKSLSKNKSIHFFANLSYYAAISLSAQQQCYINFGQAPFKHPPKGMAFPLGSFQRKPNQAPSNESSLSMCYPTVEVFALDQEHIDLVFDDSKQKQIEKIVRQIERIILDDKVIEIELSNEEDSLRMIQATIQVGGERLGDVLDLLANWIDQIIQKSTNGHVHFPDLLCQVLYPLFSLQFNSNTAAIHRNVCFVLSSLIIVIDDLKARVNLYKVIVTYLTEIIIKSDEIEDEWMLMFALVCLGNLDLNEEESRIIQDNNKFSIIVDPIKGKQFNVISALVLEQYKMCTQWFFDHIIQKNNQSVARTSESAILNPSDKSSHIKLSLDMLTVRSDHHWQSIRSEFPVENKLNVVFFEVTLHTNGPMRIGWATSHTDLSRTLIGGDENSIALDGYNQCIWHDNKRIELMTPNNEVIPRWKSGDTVGCLVDVSANSFSFYLNQQPVYFHPLGYFAKLHNYFAAVSLATFQQCRFNFGPIKLPPRQIEYHTFNSQLLNLRKSAEKLFSNIQNSFIQIGSKADIKGGVQMQQLIDETLKSNP